MNTTRATSLLAAMMLLLAACGADADPSSEAADGASGDFDFGDDAAIDDGFLRGEGVTSGNASLLAIEPGAPVIDAIGQDGALARPDSEPVAPPETETNLQPGTPGQETESQVDSVDTGRQIIRTANILAEVTDVTAAAQQAVNAVSRVGGLLFNQDTRIATNSTEINRTTLVFRMAPEDFQSVLNELGGIGNVREQTIDATDVTGRVVDLESQIASTEISVERLRGFLNGAQDLSQIATFEAELRNRETDLERLRGQLRTLQNQVGLSTITVTFTEVLPATKPTPMLAVDSFIYEGHDDGFSCETSVSEVRKDDLLTICYRVTNTGETALTDIEVRDSALDVGITDFTVVEGNIEDALEPGEQLMFAYEFTATGNRLISTVRVQATAIPAEGSETDELAKDSADGRAELSRNILPKLEPAGFADGLATGWSGLTSLIRALLVIVGLALPFIWILPLAWLGLRAWNKRRTPRANPTARPTERIEHVEAPHKEPTPV